MYVNIAVLKDTAPGERRTTLVPGVVAGLVKLGARLQIEAGAGESGGLADAAYSDVSILSDRTRWLPTAM